MQHTIDEISELAMELDAEGREALADQLWASLPNREPFLEEQLDEVERRFAAYERGESKLHTMDSAMAEARKIIRP